MLKRMRCVYWRMRDRGKGKQAILMAVVISLSVLSVLALTARSFIRLGKNPAKISEQKGIQTGTVTGTSVSPAGAETAGEEEPLTVPSGVPSEVPDIVEADTSGLDAFHGFMTDSAYLSMEKEVMTECRNRNCKSAKKLNYQQTSENTYDVASFILLSDGSVLRCDYNLKSSVVSVSRTEYSEADITVFHEKEVKAEQEALKRQQESDRKKLEAKRKKEEKAAAKKKKTGKKRKSAGRKKQKTAKKSHRSKKKKAAKKRRR